MPAGAERITEYCVVDIPQLSQSEHARADKIKQAILQFRCTTRYAYIWNSLCKSINLSMVLNKFEPRLDEGFTGDAGVDLAADCTVEFVPFLFDSVTISVWTDSRKSRDRTCNSRTAALASATGNDSSDTHVSSNFCCSDWTIAF